MEIYCDSSTTEACIVIENQAPVVISYLRRLTVNEGEYTAAALALDLAGKQGARTVVVFTDSELLAKQVNGVYKCRHRRLQPLLANLKQKLEGFREWSITWVPREKNLAGKVLE